MRIFARKPIALMLAVLMCLSMLPMTAFAAEGSIPAEPAPLPEAGSEEALEAAPEENPSQPEDGQTPEETPAPADDESGPVPEDTAPTPSEESGEAEETPAPSDGEVTPAPDSAEPVPIPEGTEDTGEEPPAEPIQSEAPAQAPVPEISPGADVEPILAAVVDDPLIEVVFRYGAMDVATPTNLVIESAHSYHALGFIEGGALTFPANRYPAIVQADTSAMRVWLDGTLDITADAYYDAVSGYMYLPARYMGHAIRVEWDCPASAITELPVTIRANVMQGGVSNEQVHELVLPSNSDGIVIPLDAAEGVVVSQNGIDLPASDFYVEDGMLYVDASPLGGGLIITAYAPVPMRFAMRSSTSTVRHTRSSEQIWYGYYTSMYTANGNVAFCLDPTISGLDAGTYNIDYWITDTNDFLVKCCYYLYGGPGYDYVKSVFAEPDADWAYGMCHAVASYGYLGSMDAFKGLDSTLTGQLQQVAGIVDSLPPAPDGFACFVYNSGSSTNQPLIGWEYNPTSWPDPGPDPEPEPEPDPIGHVEVYKSSSNAAMSDNNPCYSLAGAVFDVYYGNGQRVGSITTNNSGYGRLDNLNGNYSYYLVERTPPTGFAASGSQYPFSVYDGQTTTVRVQNTPQSNPISILVQKQDADTADSTPQGNGELSGAEFTVKYYKGYYTESQLAGVSPARTWVVRTDGSGRANLHPDYVVSGDALYYNNAGQPVIPLGTVLVQESKAPRGYLISGERYVRQITASGSGETVNAYTAPTVKESVMRGGMEIQKWDIALNRAESAQGDATLAGTVIDIYNRSANPVVVEGESYQPGAVVYTLTTDEQGHAAMPANSLPYGDYQALERTEPTGYLKTGVLSQEFSIDGNGVTASLKSSDTAVKNDVVRGGVKVQKWDAELDRPEAQGDAVLGNAAFVIYNRSANSVLVNGTEYAPGEAVLTIRTDADGIAATPADALPYGSFEIVEEPGGQPEGYRNTGDLRRSFQIREQGVVIDLTGDGGAIKNDPIRGGVKVQKWDAELDRPEAQGDAVLENATFDIYNRSAGVVLVNDVEYAPGEVVLTLTTNAEWIAITEDDALPYGSYEIVEREGGQPTGYLHTGVLRRNFAIREHRLIVDMTGTDGAIKNNPARGGVKVQKWDLELNRPEAQGDAVLENATFDIYNRSKGVVLVNGAEYAPGEVALTITTDSEGYAATAADALPYGSYEIVERSGGEPVGYLNTGIVRRGFQIREHGVVIDLTGDDGAIKNNVIRGAVLVQKWDKEIDAPRAQGGGTLEGAVIEIINRSRASVLVEDTLYAPGEVVYTLTTDATGTAVTPENLLPFGTYEAREVSPPLYGYLATGILSRTFQIREHGKTVGLDSSDTAIKNNPIRGDLKGIKISDGDANRLANVPFKITTLTTGESHTIVTDVNGEFSTAASWNPHGRNTNRGESPEDGVWFGEMDTLNEYVGALLFDDYLIEELPCASNEGMELLSFEVSVYRHDTVIDLGTLTDDYIIEPEIFTTALDAETMGQEAFVSESTTIIDTVYYDGLKAGKEYTLNGVLMDKETGEPLLVDGEEVTAGTVFRAAGMAGSVSVKFTFNSTGLAGKTAVVFERLMFEGEEIAVHTDLEDENQAVTFKAPAIGTQAAGADRQKELDALPETVIVDTVAYEGLIPGLAYEVQGTLMDKESGEALMVDGKAVTAETAFTPETESGTVEVAFTFDAVLLSGKSVVAFENLLYNGRTVAVHADIEDAGQTVAFKAPSIGTKAAGADGKKELLVSDTAVIIDTVEYENLAPGTEYTLVGRLMDKETGKTLTVDGKEITAQAAFTPEKSSGKVEVTFTFDARTLAGKQIVVFETLYLNGVELAAHSDIEDEGQTVTVKPPSIGTKATGADGKKELIISDTAVVVDTVEYENLASGKEYTLVGKLMDKETGKPLMVDGKEITAQAAFTPEKSSGKVEVTFTFDARTLAGKQIVVFETLYLNGVELAAHADIQDEAQTVGFISLALKITKIDNATNQLLDGAQFSLHGKDGKAIKLAQDAGGAYYPDDKGSTVIQTNGGTALVKGLDAQAYTLYETAPPDGFMGYSEAIGFTMTARDTEADPFPVTVYNAPIGSKVGTGARTGRGGLPAWALFAGVGAAIAAAAVGGVWIKRRKKG